MLPFSDSNTIFEPLILNVKSGIIVVIYPLAERIKETPIHVGKIDYNTVYGNFDSLHVQPPDRKFF